MRDDAKIQIGIKDRTKAGLTSINKGLQALNNSVVGSTAKIAALAGVGGIAALTAASFKSADAMGKMGDRLNLSTEAFAAFSLQAKLTGTSSETVNVSLERMVKRIGEAKAGFGAAKSMLAELNVDVEALANMRADEQYKTLSNAVAGLATHSERAAATAALFGREALSMINMISQGEEGFNAAAREAEGFGTALSRIEVAKIEAANDSFVRVGQVAKGLGDRIAINLAPLLEGMSKEFLNAAHNSKGFNDTVVAAIDNIIAGVGFLGNAWRGVNVIVKGLQVAFSGMAQGILENVFAIADGWRQLANLLPMVDIEPLEGFEEILKASRDTTADLSAELQTLMLMEMPSTNLEAWAENVKVASAAAAASVASVTKAAGSDTTKTLLGENKKREKMEADTNKFIANQKKSLASLTIGLLRTLGTENKAFALAALAVEKGLAIGETIVSTHAAAMKAMRIDPSGIMSARIEAMGAIKVGLIGATGLAVAGQISGGGGSVGSVSNPVNTTQTESASDAVLASQGATTGRQTIIYMSFEGISTREMVQDVVLPELQDLITDNDIILISDGSRQFQELSA